MIYNKRDIEYFDRIIKEFCNILDKNIDYHDPLYDTITNNQQKELYDLIIQVDRTINAFEF